MRILPVKYTPGILESIFARNRERGVSVVFGFNTNVRVADRVFHVQTEDLGEQRRVIDTSVYVEGRVVHHRSSPYERLPPAADAAGLRRRVEHQHREVIELLRSGNLALDAPAPAAPATRAGAPAADTAGAGEGAGATPAGAFAVEIRFAGAPPTIVAGKAKIEIQVVSHADKQPVPGASVGVMLEGANPPLNVQVETNAGGRATIMFPMRGQALDGAHFVIRARAQGAEDAIRIAMRPKAAAAVPKSTVKV
jgi:hypothetical protein